MNFDLQPTIKNNLIKIRPLQKDDFEILYKIASDPLMWEQHPNKDRYQKEVFKTFFKGAMESGGAFLVSDNKTEAPIGSSRFYEFDNDARSIAIGYTFISRDYWGKNYNQALKSLMIDHSFRFVNTVIFHIGAINIRSQRSIEKLNAKKIGEVEMEYYGEQKKLNFVYQIKKEDWEEKDAK